MIISWMQNNWLKISFLAVFLVFTVFFSIFAVKYQRNVDHSANKPNIVYLAKDSQESGSVPTDIPAIIQKWYPPVVRIECYVKEGGENIVAKSGSGFLMSLKNGIGVLSSKKNISGIHGELPQLCTIKLANNEKPYITKGLASPDRSDIVVSPTLEWGYIKLPDADANFQKAAAQNIAFCSKQAPLGNTILIMGYPVAGSESDITVTRGIIAAYEEPYYITDAKIGQGTSGGIAVNENKNSKKSCLLGIPTFSVIGEVVSFARILDIAKVQSDPLFDF